MRCFVLAASVLALVAGCSEPLAAGRAAPNDPAVVPLAATAAPTAGGECAACKEGTAPPESTTRVAVVDANSGGAATEVGAILADAGFDVSPGVWSPSELPAGVTGPAIRAT